MGPQPMGTPPPYSPPIAHMWLCGTQKKIKQKYTVSVECKSSQYLWVRLFREHEVHEGGEAQRGDDDRRGHVSEVPNGHKLREGPAVGRGSPTMHTPVY